MASHADAEDAALDGNNNTSLLGVDDTTQTKTTKLMTVTRGGKNYLLVDTELTVSGDVIVEDVDINDISAGTQTNDVKITMDGESIDINDISKGTQTNDVKITLDSENVNIGDISAGTQTNDVKITLDSEVVSVKDDKASSAGTSDGISVGSSSTTVLAANVNRKEAIIVNDSDETIYLKYGTGAESNKGVRLNAEGGNVVETIYTGIITGICASGGKVVTVTEV